MQSFLDLTSSDLKQVDALILENLNSNVALVEHIGEYLVQAGGKRLRPMLSLITAKALGFEGSSTFQLATAVEFIHTATLLHDDVVDESNLRRGRDTANAKWGNAPAVLVGDFVYSRAFQLLVKIGNLDVLDILSETTNVLAEGEVLQLVNAGDASLSERDYYQVIRAKTAKLFEAACEGAAILASASTEQRQQLATFGDQLGIAFQLVDDLLDYVGNVDTMGKNVGDDLAEGKTTLPLIHAMQHASAEDAGTIRTALQTKNTDQIDDIIRIVEATGSLNYTRDAAYRAIETAKGALSTLPASVYRSALEEIADYCIARTK
ncbi:polyprenyl synthetase family protein [Umboniibacter marinipuniceus]|uniref:Octaprenyl diphosphate synthase n=1 Tax=Umboniibacter marinipuniceus TaxID=569599 RepID=A0A3M0A6H7_9GAMM|nr:polyprenyl synthetase family protein [Umboniibacter marinipuniceus]RMA78408.1 octaprenyl-diphosphate synthase [Umboniibacter marinipuniceus]